MPGKYRDISRYLGLKVQANIVFRYRDIYTKGKRWVGGLQHWMCVRATRGKFWLVFVLCLFVCLFVCVDRLAAGGVCKQCLFANCLQTELLANGCRILLLGMKVLFFPVDIVLLGIGGGASVTHNLPRNHVCVRAALGKFWLVFVLCFCVCKQCLFANCLQTVCLRKIRLRRVLSGPLF